MKPKGFEQYLGNYGPQSYDGWSGEPIIWGWKIIKHLGDELFGALSSQYETHCISAGDWCVVDHRLSIDEAIKKYGAIKKIMTGPRGGLRYIVFEDDTRIYTSNIEADYSRINDSVFEVEK